MIGSIAKVQPQAEERTQIPFHARQERSRRRKGVGEGRGGCESTRRGPSPSLQDIIPTAWRLLSRDERESSGSARAPLSC